MKYATGAQPSPTDIRTFTWKPDLKTYRQEGGKRFKPEYIDDQHRVGICTAISLTQLAHVNLNKKFSADFQYLLQKKYIDGNWDEGSSALSACKAANKYGLLPESAWKHTTIEDRKLSYSQYITKLKSIPDYEIERLLEISQQYKVNAYAKIPVIRNALANSIHESKGIITRFVIGKEWYINPIEPLRPPKNPLSGHLVSTSMFQGSSFRLNNNWGTDWASDGTAYFLFKNYRPTEAWMVWFDEVPLEIEKLKEQRKQLMGKVIDLLQKLVELLSKKITV
jgi:hypothetical protein